MASVPMSRRNPNPAIRAMTPEQKAHYFSELAHRSHAGRVQLSADERARLIAAYEHIGAIMRRHGLDELDAEGEPGDGS